MPFDNHSRIASCFDRLRKDGEKGFIAYITAGDPSLKATRDTVLLLEDEGVDIVELGIPFSDPLADGRVNQMSALRALAAGTHLDGVLDCIQSIRRTSQIPILCYSYLNPLLSGGFDRSARGAAKAGMDGLLILDVPVEEGGPYANTLEQHGLDHVFLVTPTSPAERIKRIVKMSSGFVYCVSREGVTGMQKDVHAGADQLIRRIKRHTKLPVALGFGVSNPKQARTAVQVADAVVVGSAIVNRFHEAPRTAAGRKQAAAWVGRLVRAVKEV